ARMVAACFLTKHLLQDYRYGEAHYMKWLVDGDWANNNMGWQWSAGCGVDAQPWFRVFNPTAQGERFDPEGEYVKRWIPELRAMPTKWIHSPWKAPETLRRSVAYSEPIIDHGLARARFLEVAKANLARTSQGIR
ncbi:MAG: FAD-binding domain-containing protein, partial [Holophaga sp.]|nr:FAD-binding domain-containing protein [Holophaga sp.]